MSTSLLEKQVQEQMQQNEPLSYSFVSVEVAEAIGNELELFFFYLEDRLWDAG